MSETLTEPNGRMVESADASRRGRRLRIASVCTDYPGPRTPRRGLFVQRRLAALSRIADVRVIHPEPWFPWLKPLGPATLRDGPEVPPTEHIPMFYLPGVLKRLDGLWLERAVVPAIREIESSGPVDLIDAHFGYPEGVGCARAAQRLGRPFFITMRGLERYILTYPDRKAQRPQLLRALERAAGVVCVSEDLRELAESQGIDPSKIRVIPNAVDRQTFRPGDRDEARRALGVEPGARLVLSVGMLERRKGYHRLIPAFAELARRDSTLRLAIVGGKTHEPEYPAVVEKLVADLGLSDVVRLAGSEPPDRVATWLRAADLFVLATDLEGCCNAVLEAMACGLPVVTTPAGDNAEHVGPPHRGLIVPIDDDAALAGAIETALATPWDRQAIAAYGADYTWDEVARRTDEFFRERLRVAAGR